MNEERAAHGAPAARPTGGLPLSETKQQFSLGFVHLVVSAAGFWIKDHRTDYDGVDLTIVSSHEWKRYYCPEFDLQVKCTSQINRLRADSLAWSMKARPYEQLTRRKRYNQAYLGVLLVPTDFEVWLAQDEDRLITESRMYWAKASDLPALAPGAGSKTVHLPRTNVFDVEQLRGIMKSIGDGGER
jgi:Domain of unknown function (DUF4365)